MRITFLTLTCFFLLLVSTYTLHAQSYTGKNQKITVNGTSTMHDWSSVSTNISVQGDFSITDGTIQRINSGSVTLPAKSLKSTKNSGLMDNRTHETLKADNNPNISYVVTKVSSVQHNGSETIINISGNLTIAGTTKPTDLVLKSKLLPNGDIEVKGSRKILMSAYGIKPPSFMLGALKVGDEITIDYYVLLQKK